MQPIEAVGFLMYVVGAAVAGRWPRVAGGIGAALVLIQAVVLVPWLTDTEPTVRLLGQPVTLPRVPPTSAVGQVLLGMLLVLPRRAAWDRPLWRIILGTVVVVLGAVSLVVRLAQDPRFVGWGEVSETSVATGLVLVALGAATVASLWRDEPVPPRAWPLALAVLGTLAAVGTRQLLLVQRGDWIHATAASTAETTAVTLEQRLLNHALALRVLAEDWDDPEVAPLGQWTVDADRTGEELPAFVGFVWVLPDGTVGWSRVTSKDVPVSQEDLELAAIPAAARLQDAPDRLVHVSESPFGTAVFIAMPMIPQERDQGRIVGILDGERLAQHLVPPGIREDFAVTVLAEGRVVSRHGLREDGRNVRRAQPVLGTTWEVVLWPRREWLGRVRSGLPEVFLVLGVGLAVALAFGVVLAQEAQLRARQLAVAIDALRQSHASLERRVEERTEDLRRANTELVRSNQDLEHFAGVASHDLKQPLHTVTLHLQLLARRFQGQLEDEAVQWIDSSIAALKRMARLIDDLLTYARVGSREPARERVALDAAVDELMTSLEADIAAAGATIERRVGDLAVWADPVQVGQVLQNLVANALKFRREEPLRIEIGAETIDGEVRAWVRDNGRGVEPAVADRIFAMFERGSAEDRQQGTGIGLATSKKIVERHGGRIGVDSTPGSGSTFWFTMPRAV